MLQGDQIEDIQIHWYQRKKQGNWQLVNSVSESSYRIRSSDRGNQLMAVLVVRTTDGRVQRIASNRLGPINR